MTVNNVSDSERRQMIVFTSNNRVGSRTHSHFFSRAIAQKEYHL